MQWPVLLKDVVLLVLGAIVTSVWFFLRRKTEQTPVFENIQKAEKLLTLRKELDSTNYTVEDLKELEDALMGRAEIARRLSITYKNEAQQIRAIEMNGAMAQAEMNKAAVHAYQNAARRLETVIEQLKVFFSPEECVRFNNTQEAWRSYQHYHTSFMGLRYAGGSIQRSIQASAMEAVTIARLVELEGELNLRKETQVPYGEQNAL